MLLYEMVVGVAPFCFHPETKKPDADLPPPELYKNILNPKYELPFPSRLSPQICELIEQLLAWDPLTRLGCLTDGADDVQRLRFFRSIDWAQLQKRAIPPPYTPDLSGGEDVSKFEEPDLAKVRGDSEAGGFLEPACQLDGTWGADF